MTEKNPKYSIGQLAEMSNASIKQLRYLDEKGLLVPKLRNQENNYRYYSPDQLNDLVIIKTLRDLGFSFEEMVEMLQHPDPCHMSASIRRQIEKTEADIKDMLYQYERLTEYYSQWLKSQNRVREYEAVPETSGGGIELLTLPVKTVVCSRYNSAVTSGTLFINRYFELHKTCVERRIASFSSMIAIFHDGYMRQFQDGSEDLETMLPVPDNTPLGGDVRRFGGFQAVSAVHKGHYRNMQELYLRMKAWADEKQIALMDTSAELYCLGPDMTSDSEAYITRIYIPLAGSRL